MWQVARSTSSNHTLLLGPAMTEPRPQQQPEQRAEERTQWVYDEQAFPVWNRSFNRADRTDMIQDDLWAGRSIAIMLSTLVAVGLALALGTLAFVANWR